MKLGQRFVEATLDERVALPFDELETLAQVARRRLRVAFLELETTETVVDVRHDGPEGHLLRRRQRLAKAKPTLTVQPVQALMTFGVVVGRVGEGGEQIVEPGVLTLRRHGGSVLRRGNTRALGPERTGRQPSPRWPPTDRPVAFPTAL